MNCEQAKIMMHEIHDTSDDLNRCDSVDQGTDIAQVFSHMKTCVQCQIYWQQMQELELTLASLPLEQPPVDFAAFPWDELALRDTEHRQSHERQPLTDHIRTIWRFPAIAISAVCISVISAVLSVLLLPDLLPFLTQLYSRFLTPSVDMLRDMLQWLVLWNAIWRSSLTFVTTHILEIIVVVGIAFSSLLYLLKNHERQTR